MKFFARTAALTAVLAACASPAFAQGPPAGTPSAHNNPGTALQDQHRPSETPSQTSHPGRAYQDQHRPSETPNADDNPGSAHRVAAPGAYCKNASKQRVAGQTGTPFSACVKAQARLRGGHASSPRQACKDASKTRVQGQRGTAFSACMKAAAKLVKDQKAQEDDAAEQAPSQS